MVECLIAGIDPGPEKSGYAIIKICYNSFLETANVGDTKIVGYDHRKNEFILDHIVGKFTPFNVVLVEGIACYGHAVGNDIINTAYIIGRFQERWASTTNRPENFGIFTVPEIKTSILGRAKGKATEVRGKVLELWGRVLPDQLSQNKHRHEVSALSVVTCYIIKNSGVQFFE